MFKLRDTISQPCSIIRWRLWGIHTHTVTQHCDIFRRCFSLPTSGDVSFGYRISVMSIEKAGWKAKPWFFLQEQRLSPELFIKLCWLSPHHFHLKLKIQFLCWHCQHNTCQKNTPSTLPPGLPIVCHIVLSFSLLSSTLTEPTLNGPWKL